MEDRWVDDRKMGTYRYYIDNKLLIGTWKMLNRYTDAR